MISMINEISNPQNVGRFNNPILIKVNLSGVLIPQTFLSFESSLEKGFKPNGSGSISFKSSHCGI